MVDIRKRPIVPSEEQRHIIECLYAGNSVLVDAVAGSGKTTTVLNMAIEGVQSNSHVLLLTFGKNLKEEVREKTTCLGIDNLEVHSFHSLAVKYYYAEAFDDIGLTRALESPQPSTLHNWGVVVLDEAQDMKLLYFRLVVRLVRDMMDIHKVPMPRIVVLGDAYQAIFGFLGSDVRFLTLAEHIYPSARWYRLPLETSYRLTIPMATFINEAMLGKPRIKAVKHGAPVIILEMNPYEEASQWICEYLENEHIDPSDVFVLCPSLMKKTPGKTLEHALVRRRFPVYYPTSEDRELRPETMCNKIVFSTLNQAKGRERRVCIVYGFDETYFKFYDQDGPRDQCPNLLYVAVTRGSHQLILVQGDGPLPFLKKTNREMEATKVVRVFVNPSMPSREVRRRPRKVTVTDLVKYIDDAYTLKLAPMVRDMFYTIQPPTHEENIPSTVQGKNKGSMEEVSDLNGLAIVAMYENETCGGCHSITKVIDKHECDMHKNFLDFYKSIDRPAKTPRDFLQLVTLYHGIVDDIHSRIAQIKSYEWLPQKTVDRCIDLIAENVGEDKAAFEVQLDNTFSTRHGEICLRGRVDVLGETTLWEMKCVKAISLEHALQLILYAFLWKRSKKDNRLFRILNIVTGEVRELRATDDEIEKVVHLVLDAKYDKKKSIVDEDFLGKMVRAWC